MGGSGRSAEELSRQAADLFAQRTLGAVLEAAGLWARAALLEPRRAEPVIESARARIWLVEHEGSGRGRREHADAAVALARECAARAADLPACDFWLAVAVGVQAREKKLSAIGAASRIEALFARTAEADPRLEQGGPDRALALLYARAPGWPFGPGSGRKAVERARRAVALAAGFPPNHLALSEAFERSGDRAGSRKALEDALRLALEAREKGHPDAADWIREAERKLGRIRTEPPRP